MNRVHINEPRLVGDYESGYRISRLSRKYKISTWTVRRILRDHHVLVKSSGEVRRGMPQPWRRVFTNTASKKVVKLYLNGETPRHIARSLDAGIGAVRGCLDRAGVLIVGNDRRVQFRVREDYFDQVNNEEKAYWLGMMAADGWVSSRGDMGLGLKDLEAIEAFKRALGSSAKIVSKWDGNPKHASKHQFQIKSYRLAFALSRFGIVPRKSWNLVLNLKSIRANLLRHFWRGCIDGDGCLYRSRRHWGIQLSGTKDVCEAFADFVGVQTGTRPGVGKTPSSYRTWIGGNRRCRTVGDLLYSGATVYLKRKMILYHEMIRRTRSSVRNRLPVTFNE